ncbi:MAG TPA: adenylate/guanylate cyclase domain-containing protein [Nitrososphaerales archaeon]|nr:adenylate/guanylate cyclase domain-containing protein [Nitrososphaerales archaeon]
MSEGERRLAAIMFTDMVGYTALTRQDEGLAMKLLDEHRTIVRPLFTQHGGREVKTIGDSFLVEFGSALEAVRCAFDMQQALHELNSSRPMERRIMIRIGIHLGDVIHSQNDVYGDAVNVASRIEPLAPPGGVCISEQVHDHVKNKGAFQFVSLGKKDLKNVGESVEVFRVVLPWEEGESSRADLDKKRVAVLPFTNLSSDPEEGYFADGMTEELITSLSGVRQLTVIARTSVMKYKGSQKGASDIGKELNVGTLLEGSVRKAGSRVRITAQLIDVPSEGHLWAQNYDRQLEDVFAIQSEIAEKVATELKVRLVDSEKRVLEKKPTENTEAYTYYLRGRELVRENTEPSLRHALGVFEKAVALDQSYAKAYAGIAECYTELVNGGYEPHELAMPKAELSVKKAIQLDPELAEAHATLARVQFQEDDIRGSESEARRGIELNPSLPEAHFVLSNVSFLKMNKEEGIRESEACYHLDPARPRYIERLGLQYFYIGREEDALRHWEKTLQLAPAGTHRAMTEYYLYKGDMEEAKKHHSEAATFDPSHRWVTWMKGFMAARAGDREEALSILKQIEAKWIGSTTLNDIAFIYYALGDLDSYFTYIMRATEQHTVQYVYAIYCPLFAGSRGDPRYQEFLGKIKAVL